MKVKMLEHFQQVETVAMHAEDGINVSILEAGEIYHVSNTLGAWLIDNRKAAAVTEIKVPYVPKEDAPKKAEPEAEAETQPEDEPIMTSEKTPKRSKRTK